MSTDGVKIIDGDTAYDINFSDKLHKIGQLKINHNYLETGSMGIATNMEEFTRDFADLNNYIQITRADKFRISELQ